MIRMIPSTNANQAKDYFKTSLSRGDYYLNDQEMNGHFHGHLAKRIGIEGQLVTAGHFNALCDNLDPVTGKQLTPRTKADRRVGYDINFHVPKSISIFSSLSDKNIVINCFKKSVDETMQEIEQDIFTRVRTQGQFHDRAGDGLIWADFTHQTARPTKNFDPDPHLHTHIFVWNCTYDAKEDRIKAGEFHRIKRDMPYYQARFQKRLADKLTKAGFKIRKTRNAFEICTIPQKAIDLFSKRTDEIGRIAKALQITDPHELDQLGAKTRQGKNKHLTMTELKANWRTQIRQAGLVGIDEEQPTTDQSATAQKAIDHSLDHSFARASVRRDRQLLAEAYRFAVDQPHIDLETIDNTFSQDQRVTHINDGDQVLCTTMIVHAEEKHMVELARTMRGNVRPLLNAHSLSIPQGLNKEQALALTHITQSPDQIMMIRGGAGTGKTTLLSHVKHTIEANGKQVFACAPTAEAKDVLVQEGFDQSQTVAKFLIDEQAKARLKNQVLLVDEAGMLGAKDMVSLLKLAKENKTRLILCGDPRQHTAVQRGDAMRILQKVARLPYASVDRIYRQKSYEYRQAVKSISAGDISEGFVRLDALGSIQECEPKDMSDHLVEEYIKGVNDKKSQLVISPTRASVKDVTYGIRERLKTLKQLNKREREFIIYRNLYLTEAEKQDWRSFTPGQVIQAHQHLKGMKRGQAYEVKSVKDKTVQVDISTPLPLPRAAQFDVYQPETVRLSKHDLIRITKNGFDANNNRLNNGQMLKVSGFNRLGQILATTAGQGQGKTYTLSKDHGNFDYGYCLTSHSSQGKTVDRVLIAQPSATFPASNRQQFYVSVSRARETVTIYTDKKDELLQTIQKDGTRLSSHEMLNKDKSLHRPPELSKTKMKAKHPTMTKLKSYEPEK